MPIPVFAPLLRPSDAGAVVLESEVDIDAGVEVADGVGVLIEPVMILVVGKLGSPSSLVSLRVMLKGWLVDNTQFRPGPFLKKFR